MIEISPSKAVQVVFLSREGPAGSAQLYAFIDGLNDEEKAHLTAIAWVGRGAFEPEDYAEAVRTAVVSLLNLNVSGDPVPSTTPSLSVAGKSCHTALGSSTG